MECVSLVEPVVDHSVRDLCVRPYYNHPRGCPNFGSRSMCPPLAPLIENILDLTKSVYCVWNRFNLLEHVLRLKKNHPDWSDRQLACCLYWQGKARKQLSTRIEMVTLRLARHCVVLRCPEACGVNITATMKLVGVTLEWPPSRFTYQVALVGYGRCNGPTKT